MNLRSLCWNVLDEDGFLFKNVDKIKGTNNNKLGKYTKHLEDMSNDEETLLLMQEFGSS